MYMYVIMFWLCETEPDEAAIRKAELQVKYLSLAKCWPPKGGEYDQEIPPSHAADQPMAPLRGTTRRQEDK